MKTRVLSLVAMAVCALVIGVWAARSPSMAQPSPAGEGTYDHQATTLESVLSTHVRNGCVDYSALKSDPGSLVAYLESAGAVSESEFAGWSEAQQLAMLINLYNAATLKLIIDHYPVSSIKDIGTLITKPWKLESLTLFGKPNTLDHVEHELLRKNYQEPRIHFALVCAAKSCPWLASTVYRPESLDSQLTAAATTFLADTSKNRVDVAARTVHVSKIFSWFRGDFEKNSSLVEYLTPLLPEPSVVSSDFAVSFVDYDWSLNECPR